MTEPAHRVIGVYTITNTVNGKVYVGSTVRHSATRWRAHLCRLRKGTHYNKHLQAAWIKHGEAAFVFEMIEETTPDLCAAVEQYWHNLLRSAEPEFGYNAKPAAVSSVGYKHTDDAKKKMSAARAGRPISDAHHAALRDGLKRYVAEHGVPVAKWTDARKKAWSERMQGNSYGVGYKPSAEVIAKFSASLKGRSKTPEHRAKISAGRTGWCPSDATREKMSVAKRGTKIPQSVLDKRSVSLKAAWARRKASASSQETASACAQGESPRTDP